MRLLGVDVGTSAVKAVLWDAAAGRVLAAARSGGYATAAPEPGWAEQDPRAWFAAVREAVRSLCDRLAPGGRLAVEAVGLTGQMHGAVLCDGGLEPLRAAILWSDARAAAEAARAAAAVGAERLEASTGSLATANYVLPKLLWLAAHAPQALARARRVLGVACSCPISWVIHRHVP